MYRFVIALSLIVLGTSVACASDNCGCGQAAACNAPQPACNAAPPAPSCGCQGAPRQYNCRHGACHTVSKFSRFDRRLRPKYKG